MNLMKCETIPELEKFLSIQEQALGTQSPEVAATVSKLADLYFKQGQYDNAEVLYRRALEIREKTIGVYRSDIEESRQSLDRVRTVRKESSDVKVADPWNTQTNSTSARENQFLSGSHSVVGTSAVGSRTSQFSSGSSRTGQFERPGSRTGQHLARTGQSDRLLNASRDREVNVKDSSTSLDALSADTILGDQKEIDAIKEAEVEVKLIRQMMGKKHPQVADALTKLADLYCRRKWYKEMEPVLVEALKIRETSEGVDTIQISTSVKNLARLYYFQKRFDVAEPLFVRAVSLRVRALGRNHPRVADVEEQYAKLLRKVGRDPEAEELEQHVKEVRSGWRAL